jgi:hypothetical protein
MNENEMEWNETDSSLRNRVPTHKLDGSDSDDEQNTKKYMEERENYTYRYIRESHVEGDKLWYTCSNNNKCPKTIYLHMHIDSLMCSIYQSCLEHIHENFDHKSS